MFHLRWRVLLKICKAAVLAWNSSLNSPQELQILQLFLHKVYSLHKEIVQSSFDTSSEVTKIYRKRFDLSTRRRSYAFLYSQWKGVKCCFFWPQTDALMSIQAPNLQSHVDKRLWDPFIPAANVNDESFIRDAEERTGNEKHHLTRIEKSTRVVKSKHPPFTWSRRSK